MLHVAWIHQNAPLDQTLLEERFASDGSLSGVVSEVVSNWTNLSDAAFIDDAAGPRIFFGGQQSTTAGTPLGLMTTVPQGPQSWGPPTQLTDTYGTVSVAPGSGAVVYQAFESQSRPAVHVGLSTYPLLFPTSGIPNITESSPSIVTDGPHATVAWCAFGDGTGGVFTQKIDLVSDQLVGSPAAFPGSTTSYGGVQHATCELQSEVSRRTPIAARAGGGVFVAGTAGYPTLSKVLVWRLDGETLIAANAANVSHKEPEVFGDPNGRVWVGWIQTDGTHTRLVLRRSNKSATVLGAPVAIEAPGAWVFGSFEGSASAGQLDVIAQFGSPVANSIQHTIVLPGLTLRITRIVKRRSGKRVTYGVLDAGDAVAGATVTAAHAHGTTNAKGSVTLILTGSTHATATKRGYTKATV